MLKIGTKVTIQGEVVKMDEVQYKILFPSGKYGWFYKSDLTPLSDSSNPYQYGQVLVDEGGEEYKVLSVDGDVVCLSVGDNFEKASLNWHWKEVKKYFTVKDEVTLDTLTVSLDEVATLMSEKTGKKVEAKDIRIKKEE
jgi:hypothetical protein